MLTVITGPPCSGKTTYVREHSVPGDIIIDLDRITEALGGDSRDPADDVLRVARAARVTAIKTATGRHHAGSRVWVIDTDPAPWLAARYRSAGGELVTMTASAEVLHQRARDQHRPQRVHQVIDDWLAAHRAAPGAAGGRTW